MRDESKIAIVALCLFIFTNGLWAFMPSKLDEGFYNQEIDKEQNFRNLVILYNKALFNKTNDSINVYKELALAHAELEQPVEAYKFIVKYITNTLDFSILKDDSFHNIINTSEYRKLEDKYLLKVDFLAFMYFYSALIGFFLIFILNFTKKPDRVSNFLISGFVGVHVLFITEFVLYMTNLQYAYPHTYWMASSVALLYGPLLYFYFKRVTQGYKFRKIDLLHFVPSLVVWVIVLPIYMLPSSEKIRMMLGISEIYVYQSIIVFTMKLSSLIIYGFLIRKLHLGRRNRVSITAGNLVIVSWERDIYRIHVVYVISYFVYGVSISGVLGESSSFIYNSQVAAMSVMILYISYMVYEQPKLFNTEAFSVIDNMHKYEKSGLTASLSNELKENLFRLLTEEKVYKDNQLNLESLSEKLNTTRHNTSQIINERFNMSFFELINKFRIEETISILKKDVYGNMHIIDVAYEVGYNNKVTFNKAFKKETSLTPSQFIQSKEKNRIHVNWQ